MAYVKGVLSAATAIFLALCMPGVSDAFRGISQEHATGLAAVAGGLTASLLTPLFWIVAIAIFLLFFAAGRLHSKALRILLFWTPTLIVSTLGFGLIALFTYLVFAVRARGLGH